MQVKVFSSFGCRKESERWTWKATSSQDRCSQLQAALPGRVSIRRCADVCFPVRVLLVNSVLQRYSHIFIYSLHIVNSNWKHLNNIWADTMTHFGYQIEIECSKAMLHFTNAFFVMGHTLVNQVRHALVRSHYGGRISWHLQEGFRKCEESGRVQSCNNTMIGRLASAAEDDHLGRSFLDACIVVQRSSSYITGTQSVSGATCHAKFGFMILFSFAM